MMRSGKSPNMLVIGLVAIVVFVTYNYWSLSQRNSVLKNVLMADQEKLNEIEEKKIYSDKQNSINAEKVKHLEAKQQSADVALKQKDQEISELGGKLREKTEDMKKLESEIRTIKDKLTSCTDSQNADSLNLKMEMADYKKKLADLTEKLKTANPSGSGVDCESKASQSVKEYQRLVMSEIEKAVDAQVFNKIKAILEQKDHAPKASSEKKEQVEEEKVPSVLSSDDLIQNVCKLPKKTGSCQNTTDRYYFDQEAGSCKIFAYGCEGNGNNFETLDECHAKCEEESRKKNDYLDVEVRRNPGVDGGRNDREAAAKEKKNEEEELIAGVRNKKPLVGIDEHFENKKNKMIKNDDNDDKEPVLMVRGRVANDKKISDNEEAREVKKEV